VRLPGNALSGGCARVYDRALRHFAQAMPPSDRDLGPSPSRRQIARWLALGLPVAVGAGWLARRRLAGERAERPASEGIIALLVGASEAIVRLPIEPDHYRDFFEARWAEVPIYRPIYERFDAALNADGGPAFATRPLPERVRRVDAVVDDDVARGAGEFDAAIRAEVLALFASTDALVLLGYDGWPGQARGFEGLDALPRNYRLRHGPR
jgi:hypothetical protein